MSVSNHTNRKSTRSHDFLRVMDVETIVTRLRRRSLLWYAFPFSHSCCCCCFCSLFCFFFFLSDHIFYLSSVSESSEILQLLGLSVCLSVCLYQNVGSEKMLGVQYCWEVKNVWSTKVLGVQKCWECKIVGSSKMLWTQKCWKLKNIGTTKLLGVQNVGSTKLLGEQKCWEYKIVGRAKMLGVIPNCNLPLFHEVEMLVLSCASEAGSSTNHSDTGGPDLKKRTAHLIRLFTKAGWAWHVRVYCISEAWLTKIHG